MTDLILDILRANPLAAFFLTVAVSAVFATMTYKDL